MIIVTGGSGKAGRACITELLAHNYEVASVDLVRSPDVLVPFSRVELTDFGQTIEAFSQIDESDPERDRDSASRRDSRSRPGNEFRDLRHKHDQYLQRVLGGAAARH